MIQRLYVHNFRCLENFELTLKDQPSVLFIGKNGVGKSTIRAVLEKLQRIGRGVNRLRDIVNAKDFARGRSDVPIRFEIEVLLEEKLFQYTLALELTETFREFRIAEEQLSVSGKPLYSRKEAQVILHPTPQNREAQFLVDWHLVALPVIQNHQLEIFKTWLARMVILAPIPGFMTGDSKGETFEPEQDGSNFGEWFSGLLSRYPAAYTHIYEYLREGALPDIKDFLNETTSKESKSMIVRFEEKNAILSVYFRNLSDGEKYFFLGAVVIAASKFDGPLFCFWDEPDSHLSLSEVGFFITELRRSFQGKSQILLTSHHPEAIRKFSDENTLLLDRKSHLEPTLIRILSDIHIEGELVNSLIYGDINL